VCWSSMLPKASLPGAVPVWSLFSLYGHSSIRGHTAPREPIWPLEPHTKAKHELLRHYLGAWFPILSSSGPGARPMDPKWARNVRDVCRRSDVPFFFKQWGGRTPKAGGRQLDGKPGTSFLWLHQRWGRDT